MKYSWLYLIVIAAISLSNCVEAQPDKIVPRGQLPQQGAAPSPASQLTFGMKGVGIDLPQQDFIDMKNAGIDVLGTEWGMEEDVSRARGFLDHAQKAGLKVVMDGGFSYTAWGFTDDDWDRLPKGKKPAWQKGRVQNWVMALKDHPAISAWDICNEFGENLPSGADIPNSGWPQSMITPEQISHARADVLAIDSTRPIVARMHGWDMGQMPKYVQELLNSKTADIISLNLYSNYLENGKLQWPSVIADGGAYFVNALKKEDPGIVVWMSLAAFEYAPIFQRPTVSSLARDVREALLLHGVDGIIFFCWGPVNQWDDKSNWYLPKTGVDLWKTIQQEIKKARQTD
jgi:hypothetical protein